jgi:hypothetical protein
VIADDSGLYQLPVSMGGRPDYNRPETLIYRFGEI